MSGTQDQDPAEGDPADGFRDAVQRMPTRGGTVARERTWARIGAALMVLGPALSTVGYLVSSASAASANADQNLQINLGLIGVSITLVGVALFLRFSLGGILRLWLARAVAESADR